MAKKERNTKHFATEEWADFANSQVPNERREAMRRHLDTGCKDCASLLALWTRVGQAAKREPNYQPPDSAVRHVRRAFAMLTERKGSRSVFEIPRLVFDSLWQPAIAGVRSAALAPRQLLYRAGECAVEMRIEAEPGSERVNIAGQVSSASSQGEGMAQVPVVVAGAKGTLAETSTNGFGEFHLAIVPEGSMQLSLDLPNGRRVSIPLEGTGFTAFQR